MPEIIVKIDGAEAVRETLRGIAARCGNLSPVMKAIGERVAEQTKLRFNAGGPAPDGTPWAPVKRPSKKARGILRVTDHLRDSIRFQLIGQNAVVIGTNKVYGAIHQLGGTIHQGARSELFVRNREKRGAKAGSFKKGTTSGRGLTFRGRDINIPARPYLGLSRQNSDEIVEIINQYISSRR